MDDAQIRIGDRDRDQAAEELGEHLAAGRLSMEEYSERLDLIHAARTRGDLVAPFRDLPRAGATVAGMPSRPSRTPVEYAVPWRLVWVLAVIGVVTMAGRFWPVVLLLPVLAVFFRGRHGCGPRLGGRRWA